MKLLFNSFCLFNIAFLFGADGQEQVQAEEEKKIDFGLQIKRKVTGKLKDLLNNDMTHHYNLFAGLKGQISGFSVWLGIDTIIYSNKYRGHIPEDEFQWSCIRNMYAEIGASSEFLPFFGVEVCVFSKEFFNGGARSLRSVAGGKIGAFLHVSRFNISGGLFVKEGHKGLFSIKNHGVALYVSFKYTKSPVVFGGGLIS